MKIEEVDPLTVSRQALLAAKAGNPADVIWVNDLNIPKLAAGGYLTDLGDPPGDWSDYSQQPLTSLATYGGSPVALPFTTDARLTIYDKTAFADTGVTTPPTACAEFDDDALSTLVGTGKGGYEFWAGPFIHTPTMTVLSTLWMLGGDVVDAQGKVDLETDEMYKTFEYYNSLMNVDTYSPKSLLGVSDQDEYVKMLTDGDVSCQFDGTWVFEQLFDCIQRAFESYLSGSVMPQDALSQAQGDFDEGTR